MTKTLCNCFVRWSKPGIFDRIFASALSPRHIGRATGGLNSKLHAMGDDNGKPLILPPSKGQMNDCTVQKRVYTISCQKSLLSLIRQGFALWIALCFTETLRADVAGRPREPVGPMVAMTRYDALKLTERKELERLVG